MRQKRLLKFIDQRLSGYQYNEILEVGPGIGRLTKYLYKKYRNSNLTCIDIDNNLIKLLKGSFRKRDNFKLITFDASYPLTKKTIYDLIIAYQVYPFLETPYLVFDSLVTQLKNTGQLIFIELDMFNLTTNIMTDELDKYYKDFKYGMELFGCHYDFEIFDKYFDELEIRLKKFELILEEKIELKPDFFEFMKKIMSETSDIFLETVDFYHQFLNHAGWTKQETTNFFKRFLSHDLYKDYLGQILVKKIPYYFFVIIRQ
ncbi:MAG: methyltransferase domain-containing protein [Candidatus Helarchaeota archaeon]